MRNLRGRLKILLTLGVAAWLAASAMAQPVAARADAPAVQSGIVPDHFIVKLALGASSAAVGRDHGLAPDYFYSAALNGFAGYVPPGRLAALQRDPRVVSVVPDQYVSISGPPCGTPNNPCTPMSAPTATSATGQVVPTGVRRIGGLLSLTAKIDGIDERMNIDVALIDTGIFAHPDLNVAGGYNCSTGKSYSDGNGHGTHVAGTVGALDNGFGVVGVAPGARLWAVRVLNNTGSGTWSSVICGVNWVTLNAKFIKVANMSLGGAGAEGSCTDGGLHEAICNAVKAGVTFVVAAGNDATDAGGSVPANYDEVITVSALADFNGVSGGGAAPTCRSDVDDTFADFSNYGADVDIAAPGVCILSTWNNGGYNTISGTSMATPHVTGAAAVYLAAHPGRTPAQVKAALIGAWEPGPIPGDPDGIPEGVVNVSGF